MKKLKLISIWILILTYLVIITGFISEKEESLLCNTIEISILDSLNNRFLNKTNIMSLLEEENLNILGYPVNEIDIKKLEKLLMDNQKIGNSEIYFTTKGRLNIEITQHKPMVRIINNKNDSYYLGEHGTIIPVSDNFSPYVLVLSGHIHEPFNIHKINNIWELETGNFNKKEKIIYDAFHLVKFICEHEFWRSQIVQIYVNDMYEFEIIPRVGPHIIEFGNTAYCAEKFDKLETFYLEYLNKTDWNKYTRINLKFKNQVICTKR